MTNLVAAITGSRSRRLLWSYLRVLGRCWAPWGPSGKPVRLLGYVVHHVSLAELLFGFEEIFLQRSYDVALPRGAVIVDCGANIGLSVLYWCWRDPDCRVIAFEPNPAVFPLLETNVLINGLHDVALHGDAVTHRESSVTLHAADGRNGSSLLSSTQVERDATRPVVVPATSLSRHLDGPVDLLKIDIEGGETSVLEDLVESGTLSHVRRILAEVHHGMNEGGLKRFLELLEEGGLAYRVDARPRRPWRPGPQSVLVFAWRPDASGK